MKKKLKKVWEKVERDYNQGLINSESCLQAALYMHIRQELKTEKVFVEPVLEYNERGSPRFIPDLVVCRNKKIKAIIELKFAPNWYPDVGNDIEKFGKIYESDKRNNSFVTRDPATGEWEQAEFRISNSGKTKFVIAVIGQADCISIKRNLLLDSVHPELRENFFLLSGRISSKPHDKRFVVEGSE